MKKQEQQTKMINYLTKWSIGMLFFIIGMAANGQKYDTSAKHKEEMDYYTYKFMKADAAFYNIDWDSAHSKYGYMTKEQMGIIDSIVKYIAWPKAVTGISISEQCCFSQSEIRQIMRDVFNNEYKKAILNLLADEWQKYKQKCYNDSTEYKCAIYKPSWGGSDRFFADRPKPYQHIIGYIKDTVIWTHQPVIAEDFLNNLK